MREAAILIILIKENTNNSQYRVHFYIVNTGEIIGEKSMIRRFR
jgi:hypothetical protein